MTSFEAWALLQFVVIICVIVICYWRMAMQLKDIILAGTERVTDWAIRRKGGI